MIIGSLHVVAIVLPGLRLTASIVTLLIALVRSGQAIQMLVTSHWEVKRNILRIASAASAVQLKDATFAWIVGFEISRSGSSEKYCVQIVHAIRIST